MANLEINGSDLSIHARGSYNDAFMISDGASGFVDISSHILFIEIDGISFRQALVPDPREPTIQRIKLGRTQIEKLTRSPLRYIIVDETDLVDDLPVVLVEGTIKYHGFKGPPDAVTE